MMTTSPAMLDDALRLQQGPMQGDFRDMMERVEQDRAVEETALKRHRFRTGQVKYPRRNGSPSDRWHLAAGINAD